jgi:hypothetical protein
MLEQALASRRVAIDRGRLAAATADTTPAPVATPDAPAASEVVVDWPPAPVPDSAVRVVVPAVAGNSVRAAALALHRRGFHVDLRGFGTVTRTDPSAGVQVPRGATVTVWTQ